MTQLIKKLSGPKSFLIIGLFYTLIITVAFLYPDLKLQGTEFPISIDKFIHVIIHLLLSWIWLSFYFLKTNKIISRRTLLIIALLCITYGIIIEVCQQLFVDSRKADIFDIFSNTTGTFIGTLLFWKLKNKIYS